MGKRLLAFVFLSALCLAAVAQSRVSDKPMLEGTEWNDHSAVSTNRIAPHSDVVRYADENGIAKWAGQNSPYYVSLNGSWRCFVSHTTESIETLIPSLDPKSFHPDGWDEVSVPERSGSSKIGKVSSAASLPAQNNSVKTYYRQINVPKSWDAFSVRLQLHFKSACYVWVNYQYVGYAENSRVASEFDITPYLKCGKTNSIFVQTVGLSDGALLEMDESESDGLVGNSALLLLPETRVSDIGLSTSFDPATGIGGLKLTGELECDRGKGRYYVEVELWDSKGKEYEKMGKWVVFDKRKSLDFNISREFSGVDSWSDLHPNLYTAVIRVRNEKLEVVETTGTRFGFRSVGYADGSLLVNGKKITLRGVVINRLQDQTRDELKQKLCQAKNLNINAICMSAISPMEEMLYQLCDELGFYVVCDADISPFSTTSQAIASDEDYSAMFEGRVEDLYHHFKNHSSIVAWSLGSSRDNGICMMNAYKRFKGLDKQRPILYPGAQYAENSDLIAVGTQSAEQLRQYLAQGQKRSLLMMSFGSTSGNGFGGLEPVWKLVRGNEKLQGSFVSSWDGLWNNAQPTACAEEVKYLYRNFDISLTKQTPDAAEFFIINYSDHFLPSQYKIEYTIYTPLKDRIVEGDIMSLPKPGQTESFTLKVPQLSLYAGEQLYIRFVVKQRRDTPAISKNTVLQEIQIPLSMPQTARQPLPSYGRIPISVSINVAENQKILNLNGGNCHLAFDLLNGEIKSYSVLETELIQDDSRLNCWRVPTDNDRADANGIRSWMSLRHMNRELLAVEYHPIDEYTMMINVMAQYQGQDGSPVIDERVNYVFLSSGDLLVTEDLSLYDHQKSLPKVGLQFALNRALNLAEWEGLYGESYPDRKGSAVRGVFRETASSLYRPYGTPQEAGSRTDTKWVAFSNGKVGLFADMLDTLFTFSLYPYSDAQLESADSYGTLSEQQSWTLNLDYRMAGIGSAASGIPLPDESQLTARKYHFTYHLCGYCCEENDARDFTRIDYPAYETEEVPMPELSVDRARFDGPMHISMTVPQKGLRIHYTTDGSVPTEKSPLYKAPITIESTTKVSARAYAEDHSQSFVSTNVYSFDYVASSTFGHKPNTPYNHDYQKALYDGETGDVADLSQGWVGFSGSDMNVVFELSKAIDIDQVQIRFAHVPDAWVLAPAAVEVYTSSDGVDFSARDTAEIAYDPLSQDMDQTQLFTVNVPIDRNGVRYVKIVAKNAGRLPLWHKAKGLNSWILSDEVVFRESIR